MSIRYTLFGIPADLDEFLDKIEKHNSPSIDVSVATEWLPQGPDALGLHAPRYDLLLTGKKAKYRIKGGGHGTVNFDMSGFHCTTKINDTFGQHMDAQRQAEAIAAENARQLAEELKQRTGLQVTANG